MMVKDIIAIVSFAIAVVNIRPTRAVACEDTLPRSVRFYACGNITTIKLQQCCEWVKQNQCVPASFLHRACRRSCGFCSCEGGRLYKQNFTAATANPTMCNGQIDKTCLVPASSGSRRPAGSTTGASDQAPGIGRPLADGTSGGRRGTRVKPSETARERV